MRVAAIFRARPTIALDQRVLDVERRFVKRHSECYAALDDPARDTVPNIHLSASINFRGKSQMLNSLRQNWFRGQFMEAA